MTVSATSVGAVVISSTLHVDAKEGGMARIAINGFSQIGREVLRIVLERYPALEGVAINNLTSLKT